MSFTPGQLACRAELYQQLGQLTAAGLGLVRALEQIQRRPPARSYREPLQQLLDAIGRGLTFTEAVKSASHWLPAFDVALLQAGEHSGRLDACFRVLATYYFDRARMARQMISQLLYPVGLVHFAVFIFQIVLPFAQSQFNASLLLLFGRAMLTLLPFYLLAGLLLFSLQSRHGETWRAIIENVLHPLPVLGTARRDLALARLATALEALVSAGVNLVEAWDLAAAASGSPALRRIVTEWKPQLAAGRTPAEVLSASPRFPEMFANFYTSGEVSGKLDESLRRLQEYYQEEGSRKLQLLAQLVPRVIYLAVAVAIAYFIIKFYLGYFNEIQKAGGF